jgi:SWI/SNF related-matrix-associated actin-dependent regulator of chromatin subfamily C
MDRNVEMFMQIQRSLVQNRVINQPAIFLRHEIDKINTVKLKDIVKRHLGIVVEKPSEATHIVYPQPNARDEGIYVFYCCKRRVEFCWLIMLTVSFCNV